ncbi:MAG: hypothetical protein WD294_03225 [Phycisphaeraceae bacterium]
MTQMMTSERTDQASMHRWLTRQALPATVYRLLVIAAAAACGVVYLQALPIAQADDGTQGLTLLLAGSPIVAVLWLATLTAVTAMVALAITAIGRPGAGIFVVAVGLSVAVASAGSVDGWLRRSDGTSLYWYFAAEMLIWAVLWMAILLIVYQFNAYLQYLAPDRVEGVAEGKAEASARTWWGAADAMEGRSGIGAELQAGLICVVLGSLGVALLVRTADWPQVLWGVGISYFLAGLISHQISPVRNPVVFLCAPLVAGFAWYLYIATQGAGHTVLLYNYFTGQYWPAGLVMPGYYASAGVAGVMLGRGWSQGMLRQHWLGEV